MIPITAVIVLGKVANIDKTAPNITSIEAKASQDEASVTVTLNAQDSESGITKIDWKYKNGGGDWQITPETKTSKDDKGTGDTSSSFTHKFAGLEEETEYSFQATVTNATGTNATTTMVAKAKTIEKGITPTVDNIGDYVDYPIDINGNDTTTDDWRVFYVGQQEDGEANGRIFLIAADYVAHTCNALTQTINASGMSKSYDCSNEHETYYWSSAPTYHCNDKHNTSLNSAKAQCSFPDLFMPENNYCDATHRYFCSDHTSYANSLCASSLQCTDNWKSFAIKDYAEYAIGGPTVNMWVESWNTKHGSERKLYANGLTDDHGYYIGTSASASTRSQDLSSITGGYGDTLYFPHKTRFNDLDNDETDECCFGYWLASPAAYIKNDGFLLNVEYRGSVAVASCSDYRTSIRRASCSLSRT